MLTIFASTFSGYTIVGIPSEAFSAGFTSLRWLGICVSIFASYIVLMPRLRPLSVARKYVCPTDFVSDRFRSRLLSCVVALSLTVPQVLLHLIFLTELVLTTLVF
jgi:SSS family solute:Na+ symporter/sodium/pantothenate symporter